jgi:hypothetical protein
MILQVESDTFRRELPRLLAEHAGEYVLIKGDQVVGFWKTEDDAYDAGCERFAPEPFFVKKVQAFEKPVNVLAALPPQCQF